jgi:hypothetical protein
VRALMFFAVVGALLLTATWYGARRFASPDSASAIVAAGAICYGAGVLALTPPALIARRRPDWLIHAGLGAMIIRLFVTLGAGMTYLHGFAPPRRVFFNALVVGYLVILAVETGIVIGLVRRHWRPPQAKQ